MKIDKTQVNSVWIRFDRTELKKLETVLSFLPSNRNPDIESFIDELYQGLVDALYSDSNDVSNNNNTTEDK